MNPTIIITKLESHGLNRREIAAALGVSPTTLNGWMAPNAPRPVPAPAAKLLEKIWAEIYNANELRFSYSETEVIQKAIPVSGCKNFAEFAHHTIMTKARELTQAEPSLRAAEEPTEYKPKKK